MQATNGSHVTQIDHDPDHLDRTDQIDLGHLDLNLLLLDVAEDLCSTGPTQETCPR